MSFFYSFKSINKFWFDGIFLTGSTACEINFNLYFLSFISMIFIYLFGKKHGTNLSHNIFLFVFSFLFSMIFSYLFGKKHGTFKKSLSTLIYGLLQGHSSLDWELCTGQTDTVLYMENWHLSSKSWHNTLS